MSLPVVVRLTIAASMPINVPDLVAGIKRAIAEQRGYVT
jgi:hypothetical protein